MLTDLEFVPERGELPKNIQQLLDDADEQIERHLRDASPSSGFVPSDFVTAYWMLHAIRERGLSCGMAFCEWGSGFGVVTALAALLEYDACGIEVSRALVEAARQLSENFDAPAEFVEGSFVPPGGEHVVEEAYTDHYDGSSWLTTESDGAYDELGMEIDDFDVIYAFPWPNEAPVVEILFDAYAADGALLLTYGHIGAVRVQRKKG